MRKKVGLALGAGGARGLAHLGVLKVLEKNEIPIDFIIGTSMGAIVGAMYAQNPDIDAIINKFDSYLKNKSYEDLGLDKVVPEKDENPGLLRQFAKSIGQRIVLNFAISKSSLLQEEVLKRAINELVNEGKIEETQLPFCAVSTDLNTGESEIMDTGDIKEAVQVSSSIPGFFPPLEKDGKLLVDGGVTAPVPVNEMKTTDVDAIIAVSVSKREFRSLEEGKLLNIMSRVQHIKGNLLGKEQLKKADVSIEPNIEYGHWSEFLRYKEFIQLGTEAARNHLKEIKNKTKKRNILSKIWHCIIRIFSKE